MTNHELLIKLAHTKMPFGKYEGYYLIDLPEYCVVWYANKGFPKGQLGVCEFYEKFLVKGKVNFVVLEIEKAGTILSITNLLKGLQKEYEIMVITADYMYLRVQGTETGNAW